MSITDRRALQRTDVHLQATVINWHGEERMTHVLNLSDNGFMLEGTLELAEHIEVINPKTGEPIFPVEPRVMIQMPDNSTVEVTARLIYKRRLSQKQFQFGFLIVKFEGDSEERIAALVRI